MPEPNENDTRRERIAAAYDAEEAKDGGQQGTPPKRVQERKKARREWFRMDANLIDLIVIQFLTPREFQVYAVLCRFAKDHGRVRISQPMLADILDVSDRTVRSALAGLERLGLIRKWQESMGATGHIRLRVVRRIRRKKQCRDDTQGTPA